MTLRNKGICRITIATYYSGYLHLILTLLEMAKQKSNNKDHKKKHNEISRAGRKKINDLISKLKYLLPECRDVQNCFKVNILQCAVQTIERINKEKEELKLYILNLEHENEILRQENMGYYNNYSYANNGSVSPPVEVQPVDYFNYETGEIITVESGYQHPVPYGTGAQGWNEAQYWSGQHVDQVIRSSE
eukprot:TRINITY_DN1385_c0_g1_i1.p1 TRINITY_DN1385_c0_g1~~TRINITY_DN1385_c0_g1_i1.p1  ORF type:complete len:190 (+),score=34.33 TRINITY_DN1385_c0_g1_i1:155-724(+)